MMCGIVWCKKIEARVDYSKYLGPDWKPTYGKSGIHVSNHTSWMDIQSCMWTCTPSFLSKDEISRTPVIAQVANSIQTVYVKRGDTKEKRAEVIKIILQRQLDAEQGLFPPLLIFPEGATTNGSCLIKFKKGAFLSLRSVQPLFIDYWNQTNISTS